MDVAAIVPAAGSGRRFGQQASKVLMRVHGHPLLLHGLLALQASASIRWIIPVVRRQDRPRIETLLKRYRITKACAPCDGGSSRADSVRRGLAAVPREARWVLIHDGARPCVTEALIRRVVREAKTHGAAACGLPAAATIKAVDADQQVRLTLDRESLWLVQTPQMFDRAWLDTALQTVHQRLEPFPDDAAVVEAAGFGVRMVTGDALNIKVTTRDDLLLAGAILERRGTVRRGRQAEAGRQTPAVRKRLGALV